MADQDQERCWKNALAFECLPWYDDDESIATLDLTGPCGTERDMDVLSKSGIPIPMPWTSILLVLQSIFDSIRCRACRMRRGQNDSSTWTLHIQQPDEYQTIKTRLVDPSDGVILFHQLEAFIALLPISNSFADASATAEMRP